MAESWHGTLNGYVHHLCRCQLCKKANSDYSRARKNRNRDKITGDELWHGTYSGYQHHKCRCEPCKKANSDYSRARIIRRRRNITGHEPWHGTRYGYQDHMCRCEACKKAHSEYQRAFKKRRRDEITGNEPWHGTEAGYEKGCRCEQCRAAHSLHMRIRRYGISEERILSFLEKLVCKVCRKTNPGKLGWVIDHDHKCCPGNKSCGKCVRELICGGCNTMLGLANDDVETLKSAIAYIELHAA